ncbi:MAG: hypothetical protein IK137_02020 [Bacilli bacterium]|nr:hypothetical protein [Bacilli bacterium]
MNEIALKESDVSKLKKYPLDGIWSSESIIYYYKKDDNMNSILIKKLHITDTKLVNKKIDTIKRIKDSELSEYKELILPEDIIVVGGIKAGFTISEVIDSTTLGELLKNKKIPNSTKLEALKKVGELIRKVQCQNQEFYFGDVHEFNFLIGKNQEISVIDLDSASVSKKRLGISTYIVMDQKTHNISKYRVKNYVNSYPSISTDNYCYNTMVLNFLAGERLYKLSYDEYFAYIEYLYDVGIIPSEMRDIYINHYTDKKNKLVVDYLDKVPTSYERGCYNVYKALQKIK